MNNPIVLILFYVVIIGGFWWLLMRPQKKEQARRNEMMAKMADEDVIVEFGSNKNCRIPMQKSAIMQVEKPENN